MHRSAFLAIAGAGVVLASLTVPPASVGTSSAAAPVSFALLANTPFGDAQRAGFPSLVADINADPSVSFVLHAGDTKSGPDSCADSTYTAVRALVDTFEDPFVLTPGDNDWADCHLVEAGSYLPTGRLEVFRNTFYPDPTSSLGRNPIPVNSAWSDPQTHTYLENTNFSVPGLTVGTIHIIGSDNGHRRWTGLPGGDQPELRENELGARTRAAVSWLNDIFAEAYANESAGLVLMMAGEPVDTAAYADVRTWIAILSEEFGKPVLVVHGDRHAVTSEAGYLGVPNLTRLSTYGGSVRGWLRIKADPASAAVFSWAGQSV